MSIDIEKLPLDIKHNPEKLGNILLADKCISLSERVKELESKHDIKDVDMSDYTNEQWFNELRVYLKGVMGMNHAQMKAEFDKRFPDLLVKDLL